MNKNAMVDAREVKLAQKSDMEFIDSVILYFDNNRAYPGEKDLKDYAHSLKNEFNGEAVTAILPEVRAQLNRRFAEILVKDVKLTGTKAIRDISQADVAKTLVNSEEVKGDHDRVFWRENTYEMNAEINEAAVTIGGAVKAQVADSFLKNHKGIEGMTGVVTAVDYSNGKLVNVGYSMVVDLGQGLVA